MPTFVTVVLLNIILIFKIIINNDSKAMYSENKMCSITSASLWTYGVTLMMLESITKVIEYELQLIKNY